MSISDLIEGSELDIEQKIVQELLNNENLETKTELNKPMLWSALSAVKKLSIEKKLVKVVHIISEFESDTFKYLISLNRKGRLEYLQALQGIKDKIEKEKSPIQMGMNPTH